MVEEIKTIDQFKHLICENSGLVIVDFFADWCGPCKKISPFFETLSSKYPSVKFYKINCDNLELDPVTTACEISSLPSFCYFVNGHCVHKMIGANEDLIEGNIVQILEISK